jgi:hypothetical protein
MKQRSAGGQPLAFLSSLRLAVVTMVTLGSVCGFATFYEMRNGTPAVQRDIYQTPWFIFLLALLGTNLVAVMVSRHPWNKHHIGFLTAHVGILMILLGSVLSLFGGLDSNLPLYEGETADHVLLLQKALQVTAPNGARGSFPVVFEKRPPGPGHEQHFKVPGSDVVLAADDYQPHVTVQESYAPAETGPAALHLVVKAPMATQDAWLVPDDPARSRLDLGMVSFGLHSAASEEEARRLLAQGEGANHLSLVLGPGGSLRYAAADGQGRRQTGTVATGKAIATGWPALGVSVDHRFPSATLVRSVVPEKPPTKEERRRGAVRVRLESPAARGEPEWVLWGEQRRLRLGDRYADVGYQSPEQALPFRVTLIRFNDESYPGSRMAATYESTVRIDDPERGSFETLISMNHPFHHRGYIFFQSSFVEGRPMMSIFSVARAPGLPLVYLGVVLIATGVVWMFYVKPYLAKRQAALALAARRARENPYEAKPSDALSAGTRSGQPASGRA